jgi:hypothetical protein
MDAGIDRSGGGGASAAREVRYIEAPTQTVVKRVVRRGEPSRIHDYDNWSEWRERKDNREERR